VTVTLGWGLAAALMLLVGLAVGASAIGRLRLERQQSVAALRAIVQLAIISTVIAWAVAQLWSSLLLVAVMFTVAVFTTVRRVGAPHCWPWTALAMAAGVVPVLAVVFATGASPFTPVAVLALAGIIVGNMMTGHTLAGRRCFSELRNNQPSYAAALSIGLERPQAIGLVIEDVVPEALIPNLDQVRTVGLVTLPGAFIGVLLGGGSPVQAGTAQVLVLLGIMAGQAITVTVAAAFIRAGRLLPRDLAADLRP
jgi:putative ABC transport system permease protein